MSIQRVAALTLTFRGEQQPTLLLERSNNFPSGPDPWVVPYLTSPDLKNPFNLLPRPPNLTLVTADVKTAIQSNNSHSLLLTWLRHDGSTTH